MNFVLVFELVVILDLNAIVDFIFLDKFNQFLKLFVLKN